MTNYYCAACMTTHDSMADCTLLRVVPEGETQPATRDDALEAIVLRLHTVRAALRGVLVDTRRAGLTLSPETATLVAHADSFDP